MTQITARYCSPTCWSSWSLPSFSCSLSLPAPWRFYLWGLALVVSLLLPLVTLNLDRRYPRVQTQIDRTTDVSPSAVERFGLFFPIIVLGEVVVAVVRGVAGHHHLSLAVGATGSLGMLVAIGPW